MRTVAGFDEDDVHRPSLLPGWSRGHVLAHVARTADALGNLLRWARAGVPSPAYASQQARDADIETGGRRSPDELRADLISSARGFGEELAALPEESYERLVHVLGGTPFPAGQLLARRLAEVELHHTDLDAGYRPDDWSSVFAALVLPEPMRTQREDRCRWFRISPR